MSNNSNQITINFWSNPVSQRIYVEKWPDNEACRRRHENGQQCGACSFFAPFNEDWGLCTHSKSEHHLETVFEHFTCNALVLEGWGPHSFSENENDHCRCRQ